MTNSDKDTHTDPFDDSRFYSNPQLDDDGDAATDQPNKTPRKPGSDPKKHPHIFLLLLEVMSNPPTGWKRFAQARMKPETVQRDLFYPLCALVAACQFVEFFYDTEAVLSKVLTAAIEAFISIFFSYFIVMIASRVLMPKSARPRMATDFSKVFVLVALSSLCIFYALYELLPMLEPVLVFLPLWTVYIVCQGAKFLRFPTDKSTTSLSVLCLLIVGIPICLGYILHRILP